MELKVGKHYKILEIHKDDEYSRRGGELPGTIVYCTADAGGLPGGWLTGDFMDQEGEKMFFYGVKLQRVKKVTRKYTLVSMEKEDTISDCTGCLFEPFQEDCQLLHEVFGYSCAHAGIVKLEDQFEVEEWDEY